MNRGAWGRWLIRIGREWNRTLESYGQGEVEWKEQLRNSAALSYDDLRGFKGLGEKQGIRGFANIAAICGRRENWRKEWRTVEKWQIGRDSASVSHISATPLPGIFSSMTPALFGFHNVRSRRGNRDLNGFKILLQDSPRGFAKTTVVPPQMQKPMKLRLYMGSPGVIGEPYKKSSPPLSLLRSWFTKEGWRRRKQSFMGMIKTSYTIAKLRQKSKGYSQQRFYQEASDLYKQINVALAEGERTQLRQLVTDSVFSVMKNEIKHRETTWAKVNWEMVGPIKKIRTLQGRLIGVDKNNQDNAFVQLTLRILSKQKFAAYDKRGKLVAGDPDNELLVEDYWVFEKPLLLTEAKWRLCGRLSV